METDNKKYINDFYERNRHPIIIPEEVYHFWVSNKTGYRFSSIRNYNLNPAPGERFKYLGYTRDIGWPKTMNTGRILHKPSPKDFNKKRKIRKQMKLS